MNRWIVGQKAILYNPSGKILVLTRSCVKGMTRSGGLDLPGGALNVAENPVEGIIREIKEETGLNIRDIKIFDALITLGDESTILLGYQAKADNSELNLSIEHASYEWMDVEKFMNSTAPEIYKKFVKHSQIQ